MCLQDRDEVLFGQIETESFESDFELVVVDVVVFVEVEEGELFPCIVSIQRSHTT